MTQVYLVLSHAEDGDYLWIGSKILEISCLKTAKERLGEPKFLVLEEGEIIEIDSPNQKRSKIMVNQDEEEEYIFQENIIGSFLQQEMNAIDSTIESKKTAGKPVETTTPQKKRDHAGEPVLSPQETSFGEPELFSGQPPGKPEASPHLHPKKTISNDHLVNQMRVQTYKKKKTIRYDHLVNQMRVQIYYKKKEIRYGHLVNQVQVDTYQKKKQSSTTTWWIRCKFKPTQKR